ncbi:MAG: alpha/beta hydrolase [Elusimicrobia bacterium]|nr:alpha/beta hydrolase [Elusimicrobiota bacterium]
MPSLRVAGILVFLAAPSASAAVLRSSPAKAPVLIPSLGAPAITRSPLSGFQFSGPALGAPGAISWDGSPSLPSLKPIPVLSSPQSAPSPIRSESRSVRDFMDALSRPVPGTTPSVAEGSDRRGMESLHQDSSALFDGLEKQKGSVDAQEDDGDITRGWAPGKLRSQADGAVLTYRSRKSQGPSSNSPIVFIGGLALAESFDSYFKTQAPSSDEYFLWLRGHQPSAWTATREVYDSDGRDMAAMIVEAARSSGSGQVRLVAHSYGVLVFQRMLQLSRFPEVRQALNLLKGGRVTLLNVTTHYGDSETAGGDQYAQMARIIRAFISWLDMMDSQAALMRRSMELNPALAPAIIPALMAWEIQRTQALSMASQGAVKELKGHLAQRWDPPIDAVRRRLLKVIGRNSSDPGWQEAFLRRANDTSKLEFTKTDAERLRTLGIGLDLIHSKDDQLIPWVSAKLLFDLLAVPTPDKAPGAGSSFESADGLFRAKVVDGDHYFPLRKPAEFADLLAPRPALDRP